MEIIKITLLTGIILCMSCQSPKPTDKEKMSLETASALAFDQPPHWAKEAIWYQIFVERFRNGDLKNDPTLETMQMSWPEDKPQNWNVTSWTSDWYAKDSYTQQKQIPFYENVQMRRYGGDLQGVIDQLDYLQNLGVNAIYFNPLNDSPSAHKYDARNYHHIDVNFGPDPQGDLAIIAQENSNDPQTWQWTSADKLFLQLVEELHKREMHIILDYSWNHTGIAFWAWQDIVKKQAESAFKDWYMVESFKTDSTEFKYEGWAGVSYMPELKKVNVQNRKIGQPYEGEIEAQVKKHIFAVSQRWLSPDGQLDKGVDGYRLDVADQVPMGFWREYRKFVRSVNPATYLVGEIWWDEWPDKLMDPRPYLQGDIFDAVMHYQQYKPARDFFAYTEQYGGAEQYRSEIERVFDKLPQATLEAMMFMSASHDTPRLLTSFNNTTKYKYNAKPMDNPTYKCGKPQEEVIYQRAKLFLMHQYTFVGSPQIWNGDEMGMWGADDPDNRKPLWWKDMTFADETQQPFAKEKTTDKVGFDQAWHDYYKQLIEIRNKYAVLKHGKWEFLQTQGPVLAYRRYNEEEEIVVIFNVSDQEQLSDITQTGEDVFSGERVSIQKGDKLAPLSGKVFRRNIGSK